jgi:hypothetical protein
MGARMHKAWLLSAGAALTLATSAQAADLPVKAKPVEYVRVCGLYGEGFFYIPGTDTCLKIGAYLRAQTSWNSANGGQTLGTSNLASQGRLTRTDASPFDLFARVALSTDWRTQTDYGVLRAYAMIVAQQGSQSAGATGTAGILRAFIQFAGFTVGHARSYFDIFGIYDTYAYHYSNVTGETTPFGIDLVAYTFNFGNGWSASVSAEDPAAHYKAAIVDATSAGFGLNAVVTNDSVATRTPDVVANIRLDQTWGYFGVSGALHDASAAYFGTPDLTVNGHPDNKWGWAAGVGGRLNLNGGDSVGANFVYTRGAAGYATSITNGIQLYNGDRSVGVGWLADGVFDTTTPGLGRQIELTTAWSVIAAYEHLWSTQWRTSVFGGYVDVSFDDTAKQVINTHLPGGGGTVVCGVPVAGSVFPPLNIAAGGVGNSCNPNFSFYELGTRTQWSPSPRLDIGLEVLWTHLNTAYKGAATYSQNGARPLVGAIDDQDIVSAILRAQYNILP